MFGAPVLAAHSSSMPRFTTLILIASLAMAVPHSLQAQFASAPVGVVRAAPETNVASAEMRLVATETEPSGGTHVSHLLLGGLIGATVGALVTVAVVLNCQAHDTTHGEGPSCGIAIPIMGPPAVLVGAMLGVIVADW